MLGFLRSMGSLLKSTIRSSSTKMGGAPSVFNHPSRVRSYTLTMNMEDMFGDFSADIATLDLWEDSSVTISHKGLRTIFGYPLQLTLSENKW